VVVCSFCGSILILFNRVSIFLAYPVGLVDDNCYATADDIFASKVPFAYNFRQKHTSKFGKI